MDDTGACHVCGEEKPVDGEQATKRFGEVLCRECADEPVKFEAECTNRFCSWSYEVEGDEFDRGHLKTRVQQEANSQERKKEVFDEDPMHHVEYGEVDELAH